MTNKEKALKLARITNSKLAEYPNLSAVYEYGLECAMKMAEWKDEQLKKHEQSLLWTFESILDKIDLDRESYNIAIKEFKNQLINEMTNKEKAKSLYFHFCNKKSCKGHDECTNCPNAKVHEGLIQMAKWKDEQFEKEKKELRGLVDMLQIDDHNQTIIEDLIGLLS